MNLLNWTRRFFSTDARKGILVPIEEDTHPTRAALRPDDEDTRPIFRTISLDIIYLWNPATDEVRPFLRGAAASYFIATKGWVEVSEEFESGGKQK